MAPGVSEIHHQELAAKIAENERLHMKVHKRGSSTVCVNCGRTLSTCYGLFEGVQKDRRSCSKRCPRAAQYKIWHLFIYTCSQ